VESYQSVFEETIENADSQEGSETKEKEFKVKPLTDILGENAEEKLNIKLFDAPQYFDNDEEKEEVDGVLKQMFEFLPPSEAINQKVFGLEPESFKYSTINPMRQ
jgi:hypothetical protein